MPDKMCTRCRHYEAEWCGDVEYEICLKKMRENPLSCEMAVPLDDAREICDREGDGHFVYFEPKDEAPETGAAFVQITREPRAASAAGGAR